jgi:predicted NBD/HSP70 family sugar kinase
VTIAGNQGFLKHLNRNAVLRLLYTHPGASRAELARLSRLTRMTVGALVAELVAEGWVREGMSPRDGNARGEAGRPGTSLELNPDRLCALGAEVGVDYTTVVVCDPLGRVLAQVHFPRAPQSPSDAASLVSEGVNVLLEDATVLGRRVLGLGVSVPGPVQDGVLRFAPNLGWGETRFLELLTLGGATSSEHGWLESVLLENEANAAALGEYFFRFGEKPRSLVYLSLGVGVGCGIVIEGQVFRGAGGFAGEVGHTILYPPDGSAEAFVSQRAVARHLGVALTSSMSVLLESAVGQPEAVVRVGRDLGLLLANLVNTFSPDELVIGGPLGRFGDALLRPALETMRSACGWRHLEMVRVRLCDKLDRASAIGAAGAVWHGLLHPSSRGN